MKRILNAALAASCLAGAVACKRAKVEVSTAAYIVGPTNDIRPARGEGETEIPERAVNAAVLVATRLADKRVKFCSGTLVSPEAGQTHMRVLTNHHCFAVAGEDGKATRALLVEACSFTTVYFGYVSGHVPSATSTGCQAGTLRSSFEGDLAVFTLAQNPPAKHQPLALWDGDEDGAGRAAGIVHYPDVEAQLEAPPEGGARLPTAAVTVTDCKVIGLFNIAEWDLDRTLPYSLRHTCDLIHGSSGSALIDLDTGTLLGVNWGGIKVSFDSGVRIDNVATRASFAKAFLESRESDALKLAAQRRAEHGAAALPQSADASAEKEEALGKGLKPKACGVAGAGGGFGVMAMLALMALVPLAFEVSRRR